MLLVEVVALLHFQPLLLLVVAVVDLVKVALMELREVLEVGVEVNQVLV